ncbi:MAG: putative lipid II flippase FtsW, partial [Actinomycetota bacterium]|nr:putative lipid II flippase FtsW [Actinomycetota bacterium]
MVSTPTRPVKRPTGSTVLQRPLPGKLLRGYRRFWSALEGDGKSRNGSTYYLILGTTLALTAIGIMMVLSASSVEAIAAGESPYSAALKQGLFAGIGIFFMFM